jgi:hypothetical protein
MADWISGLRNIAIHEGTDNENLQLLCDSNCDCDIFSLFLHTAYRFTVASCNNHDLGGQLARKSHCVTVDGLILYLEEQRVQFSE